MYKIPVYSPSITELEKSYVNDCLDSSWISSKGEYVGRFESAFSNYVGSSYATSVCNGTTALHLAMLALGIGKNDEVIVSTLTYIASVNAINYVGAMPVFVDCDKYSWQISPEEIEKKITKRTKAIMVVHLYGQSADMKSIMEIASRYGLFVIEDCAEAFGTKFNNQHVGTFGDVATFSFFGNKTITTGEGGMVVTNRRDIYDKCFHLKSQGLASGKQYWHDIVGYNYRMTNIACAIGLAQLERAEDLINKKRRLAEIYENSFINSKYEFHSEIPNTFHSYWMSSVLLPLHMDRDISMIKLLNLGIETRPVFYQAHTMPMYQTDEIFPIAKNISSRGINLPSFPDITDEEISYVIESVMGL